MQNTRMKKNKIGIELKIFLIIYSIFSLYVKSFAL